jgi:hypothetical protein
VARVLRPSPEEAKVIYEEWAKKFYWSSEEATALVMGTSPEALNRKFQQYLPVEVSSQFDKILDLTRNILTICDGSFGKISAALNIRSCPLTLNFLGQAVSCTGKRSYGNIYVRLLPNALVVAT